ncbi:MAG: hypothetical protein SPI83_08880 [Rothia sp. (in: high G+C Gram-positive bacteria)]|nr:hypothetical protein [Rothia sp. (in: high G+C Gram-positive bacteria)]
MNNPINPLVTHPEFIWRDITWRNRAPYLKIEPLTDGQPSGKIETITITPGSFLGLQTLPADARGAGTYCTGYAKANTDSIGFHQVPCPHHATLTKGKQCNLCFARDEFAPIHRIHIGSRMTEAALAYVNLEHYLYIATFPDGTSKVGTASLHSNPRRLDDQAVAAATFVARADTGIIIRQLEDLVSHEANLTQFKHASTKYKAWVDPASTEHLKSAHYMAVENATWALDNAQDTIDGFDITANRWVPSAAMSRAYASLRAENPEPLSAHPTLTEGAHGFYISGGTGKFLTAHFGDPDQTFLINTAELSNRACRSFGELTPPASVQESLF